MARRKKYKPKPKNFFPKAVWLFVIIVAVTFTCRRLNNFFIASPFFNVSKIELAMNPILKEALDIDFYNIPRHVNIFQLDIDSTGMNTQRKHPEFESVIVSRRLPDVISVRIKYKKPAAFLKDGQYFIPVSGDGITLPAEVASAKNLPIFTGIKLYSRDAVPGSLLTDRKLQWGLKFIKLVESLWDIENCRIDVVDLNNIKEISFYLADGVCVKVGDANNMKTKLGLLKKVINEPGFDFEKIAYIDLRFSDVVIGPKLTAK